MFKVLAFIKAKNGINYNDFVEYYENIHSVLISELFPSIVEYNRRYFKKDASVIIGNMDNITFDAITEMHFKDRDGFDMMIDKFNFPEIFEQIKDDEDNFIDRSKTILISID